MKTTRLFVTTALLMMAGSVRADEFLVNTRTSNAQRSPSIAVSATGDLIVAWSSYYTSSGRSNEIRLRRFDRAGAPLDVEEFQANTTHTGNQCEPAVAISADGNFVVVWQGPGPAGTDIFARLFDPNGMPLTDELLVNAAIPSERTYPRVAANNDGSFVVVWEDRNSHPDDPPCVWGQSFDASGAKQGDEFLVAADLWGCRYPDVATDADGNFVVTWMLDRSSRSVQGRLFDSNGSALTDPFDISEIDFSSITRPAIAMDSQGRFVVTWDGDPNLARLDDIHARCFEPNGVPLSGQFFVNTDRAGAQQWPRVAVNDANEVVIVWQSDTDDPNTATNVYLRCFDMQGRPTSGQVRVNTWTWGRQRYPDVALTADGAIAVAWEDAEPGRSDYNIFALYGTEVFWPDLTGDGQIDLHDFQVLAASWRHVRDGSVADLNQDGRIDARDLKMLCHYWLQ